MLLASPQLMAATFKKRSVEGLLGGGKASLRSFGHRSAAIAITPWNGNSISWDSRLGCPLPGQVYSLRKLDFK